MSEADRAAYAIAAGQAPVAWEQAQAHALPAGRHLLVFADGSALLVDGQSFEQVTKSNAGELLRDAAGVYAAAHTQLVQAVRTAQQVAQAVFRAGVGNDEIAAVLGVDWSTVYRWTAMP